MLSKFQGFNAALTEAVDIPGRRGTDQVKEMNSKLRPELKGPLTVLCNDPKSTIVILSGSTRNVLDDVRNLLCFFKDLLILFESMSTATLFVVFQ